MKEKHSLCVYSPQCLYIPPIHRYTAYTPCADSVKCQGDSIPLTLVTGRTRLVGRTGPAYSAKMERSY